MLEKQDKTIAILPHDLILKIFSDKSLGILDNTVISLVCRSWNRLSSDNTIWKALFLRSFSWSPTLFYPHFPLRESYKKQLLLNNHFEEKCTPNHQCSTEPGLVEAVRENNLPLVEALLHSGHRICINSAASTLNEFFDKCLQVLSESTKLPPRLVVKIFKIGLVDENMERYGMNLFHILCLKADPTLLETIFTILGDDLLEISRSCDGDGVDLFSHLLNYPFYEDNPVAYADVQVGEEKNRLSLILEKFYNALGKAGMRRFLTSTDTTHESFIHVLANNVSFPDGNHHFFKAFSYLEKEDYWILLNEGSNYFDIPLFQLIHCSQSFKQLMHILGDDAPRFLRHENCNGRNFLYFLLFYSQFTCIPLLEEVMGQDFIHLLVKDKNKENMLRTILGTTVTGVREMIIQVLRLMNDYECIDIIKELHDSPEFHSIVNKNFLINENEISDIFNEHLEENTFSCTLL